MGRRLSEDGISDRVELLPQEVRVEAASGSAMMESRSRATRLRGIVGICLLLALAGIVYLGYFCPDHVCALTNRDLKESARVAEGFSLGTFPSSNRIGILGPPRSGFRLQSVAGSLGYEGLFVNDSSQFDINAHDVMIFLHVQKTGEFQMFQSVFRPLCRF